MAPYEGTIKEKVSLQRLSKFLSAELRARLIAILGANPIAVWGSEAGQLDTRVRFRSYERIQEIDDFFSGSSSGLSMDLFVGKAERVA